MARSIYFITHLDVVIDPTIPVPQWPLSARGRSRMRRLLSRDWIPQVEAIYCSTEQKAVDGAAILSEATGIPLHQVAALGENTSPERSLRRPSKHSLPDQARAAAAGSAPSPHKPV